MEIVAAVDVCVILFNTLIVNRMLLRRWGVARAELLRAIVNIGSGIVVNHVSGWPVVCWLFLPYAAIVHDHFDRRVSYMVVATNCVAYAVVATYDGVHWGYPAATILFAAFCSTMSRVRYEAMREMTMEATQQRQEIEATHQKLAAAERELRQAQKLEALGRLASGVAHEMNTPIQFAGDSLTFAEEGIATLLTAVDRKAANDDVAFVIDELPKALSLVRVGLDRVATIVRSMRQLAHPGQVRMQLADVNEAVKTAVTLASAECKSVADVSVELAELPPVPCFIGELGQVMLNLLVNSAQAIGGTGKRGHIRVASCLAGDAIVVTVADDGPGIPASARDHVFDPFFTTKDVGKGTGQGLAIAEAIIAKHGGSLTFDSAATGTTFRIELPVRVAQAA
jgi:signal transduction histidine kinase